MYVKIRMLMLTNKITFNDIAKALKVSRNNARNKINGKANMTVEDIKILKEKFFTTSTYDELMEQNF